MSTLSSEVDVAKYVLKQLAPLSIVYPDHYVPYEKIFRPKSLLPSLSYVPTDASNPITLRFKCIKPSHELSLTVSPHLTIAELKTMVLQRWSYDPSWTCKFLYKGKVLVNEKALDMYPGLESGAGGFIHVMFGTPVSTLVTTSSSSTESPTSSTPLPTTTTTPVSPMEAFGKNAAFWGDIRQVVEKHGLMAGYSKTDVTKIVNAFSHALFQLYK